MASPASFKILTTASLFELDPDGKLGLAHDPDKDIPFS